MRKEIFNGIGRPTYKITRIMKFIIIIPILLLAISCTKPASKNPHIPPVDADADADYCIDLRSKPKARLVKKYRDLEPVLLNILEKQYIKCKFNLNENYVFYFFEDWVVNASVTISCMSDTDGDPCGIKYEISPVTQIDYPESEIIYFNEEHHKKEDLLQFKDKIIDVEIHKRFPCPPILDTSFSIIFRARITGECENLPPLRWNIGATDKDSVIAELISEETLVIRGNGKMMDFKKRPWDEICGREISNVVIENGVTHIGKNAFWGCNLDSITIPSSVTSTADYAFSGSGLDFYFYNVPDIVAYFGKSTFSKYGSFSGSITTTIPDSVFYIDEKLLSNFKRTAPTIKISNPIPPRLAGDVSGWIKLFNYGTLYVPKGSIDAYLKAEGWKECKNIKPIE